MKIIRVLLLIILVFPFNIKAEEYTDNQKGLLELAEAYYRKNSNIQYCKGRRNDNFSPEQATVQQEKYTVCSGFTYNLYREALGLSIPKTTAQLTSAAYYYPDEQDIIKFMNEQDISNQFTPQNEETIDSKIRAFIKDLYNSDKIKVGDLIILLRKDSGHVVMVGDSIKEGNEIVDANIYHSSDNYEKVSTKITIGLSYDNEGTIKKSSLFSLLKSYYKSGKYNYLTVYRPLAQGNNKYNLYSCKKNDSSLDSYNPMNFSCTKQQKGFVINKSTEDRIKYPLIDIEKTVSSSDKTVINQSYVDEDDYLIYNIKITNNSSISYPSLLVTEEVSDLVDIVDLGNGLLDDNIISWNIDSIHPNESINITYKVKVKEIESKSKEIISTGRVGNIKTADIVNKVETSLNSAEEESIIKTYNELKDDNLLGLDFINEIYKKSNLEFSFNLDSFDIEQLINNTNGTASSSLSLNRENPYSKYVLNDYFGALNITNDNISLKSWNYTNNKRASKIYREHFKTGDILIYKDINDPITHEDGLYSYIFINNSFYGINKLSNGEYKNEFSANSYIITPKSNNTNNPYLTTLLGKDSYVILRPSIEKKTNKKEEKIDSNSTLFVNVPNTQKMIKKIYLITAFFSIVISFVALIFILYKKKKS